MDHRKRHGEIEMPHSYTYIDIDCDPQEAFFGKAKIFLDEFPKADSGANSIVWTVTK